MTQPEKKSSFFLKYIFPILLVVIGWALGAYLTPNDNSKEILTSQIKQIEVLNTGFKNVIASIEKANITDSNAINSINEYAYQLNSYTKNVNNISTELKVKSLKIDTVNSFLTIPKTIEDSSKLVPKDQAEIKIKIGSEIAQKIDQDNYISVLRNPPDSLSIIAVLNGSHYQIRTGSKLSLRNTFYRYSGLIYRGVIEGYHTFVAIRL